MKKQARLTLWIGLLLVLLIGLANVIYPPWEEPSDTVVAEELNERLAERDWETRPWLLQEVKVLEPIRTPPPAKYAADPAVQKERALLEPIRMPPPALFEAELRRAHEAWEEDDGHWTTVNDPGDMPTRNLWKTADRHDDDTQGVAPLIRKRLRAGQLVLIYDGPVVTYGVEMWKITDGDTYGWISELQLTSVPMGPP